MQINNRKWNILTIDIDSFIKDMKRISETNDTDLTPYQSWQVVRWKTGIKRFEIDNDALAFTLSLIKNFCKSAIIENIEEHDEIIGIYEKYDVKGSVTWNWDFHLDCGYKPNLEELNLSNWAVHARQKGYISQYNWVRHDDSEFPINPFIQYSSCSYKDLKANLVPQFDLVVICTSKHFTPIEFWKYNKLITDYAFKCRDNIGCFKEIKPIDFPKINPKDYPNYFMEGVYTVDDRIFKSGKFYVGLNITNKIPMLSFINLGETFNIIGNCRVLFDNLINQYGIIGFKWNDNVKSGIYIKRLIKHYKSYSEFKKNGNNYLIVYKEV